MSDFIIILIALVWSTSQIIHLSSTDTDRIILKLILGPFGFLLPKPKINLNTYISAELLSRLKELLK